MDLFSTCLNRGSPFWNSISGLPSEGVCGCLRCVWKVSSALGVMLRHRQQPREGWHGGAGRLENKQAGDKDSVCTRMETTGPGREGTTRMAWREVDPREQHGSCGQSQGSGSVGMWEVVGRRSLLWGPAGRVSREAVAGPSAHFAVTSNLGKCAEHQLFSGTQGIHFHHSLGLVGISVLSLSRNL